MTHDSCDDYIRKRADVRKTIYRVIMMSTPMTAFVAVLVLGVVAYLTMWWEGTWVNLRFTKWYFAIIVVLAIATGGYFWFTGDTI